MCIYIYSGFEEPFFSSDSSINMSDMLAEYMIFPQKSGATCGEKK